MPEPQQDGCACCGTAPAAAGPDLVCTLDGGLDAMRQRFDEWRAVVGQATAREPAEGGLTLVYRHEPALTVELARLAAAEFACCSFFSFTLTVAPAGMRFTISAPDEASDVVTAVFGSAPGNHRRHAVNRISRDELRGLIDAGALTLVEALPAAAYEADHLPGAVNVPGDLTAELAARVAPDRAGTVVVYCAGPACVRSTVTAAAFERLGYTDVRVYAGGKLDWWDAGLPLEGSRAGAVAR